MAGGSFGLGRHAILSAVMSEQAKLALFVVVPLFCVFFTLIWAGVVFSVSRFSGWAALAKAYPAPAGTKPTMWRYRTAYLRFGSRYRGVLAFDADAQGFTVAPMWLFGVGHKPIRVPWSEVATKEETWLFFPYVTLTFAKVPGLPMRIPQTFGRELLASAGR